MNDLQGGTRRESAVLAILAFLGFALTLIHTRFGVGTTGDSVHYMMGAENLLAGNGISRISGGGEIKPITGFPPLYFLTLGAVDLLPGDLFSGIRAFNALIFAANIFMVGWIIFRFSTSIPAAALGQAFILTFHSLLEVHTWVVTEPLFIFCMLFVVYALASYFDRRRLRDLVLATAFVSLASLTRYVGLSLMLGGVLSIVLFSQANLKRRVFESGMLASLTLIPILVWFRRNTLVSGVATNRPLAYMPIQSTTIRIYFSEVLSWFIPRELGLPRPVRNGIVVLMTVPGLAIFYFREFQDAIRKRMRQSKPFWTLPWIIPLITVSYVAILLLNSAFLDPALTPGGQVRYLIPIFVLMVILMAVGLHRVLMEIPQAIPRILLVLVGSALLISHISQAWGYLRSPLHTIGYTGLRTLWPDTVEALNALDPGTTIVTNNPELAYILSGRPAYQMPIRFLAGTEEERADYADQIEATREKLEAGGVLFIFGPPTDHDREVIGLLDAEILMGYFDSAVFGYPQAVR